MIIPDLLAHLSAIGCSSTLIDAWWRYAKVVLPDGRHGWTLAQPGDHDVVEQAYRLILRPHHATPVLLQYEPSADFPAILLRSRAAVRDVAPRSCHPEVDSLVRDLYRHPGTPLRMVR